MNTQGHPAASSHRRDHRSYLLRLWRSDPEHQAQLAQLQDLQTGQQIGFASLEQLFSFLVEQAEGRPRPGSPAG